METIMLGYIPKLPIVDRSHPARNVLLTLGSASLVALMMAWVGFLLWLAVEGVIVIARWL